MGMWRETLFPVSVLRLRVHPENESAAAFENPTKRCWLSKDAIVDPHTNRLIAELMETPRTILVPPFSSSKQISINRQKQV